ncbi:MAG TPA: carboxymuconolactone decarboxylase family protein [Burkholderiales bacterium]|nr:carboxymuconolactone decarboxylase family protein [Burkholderiales bacterium]
MNDQNVETGDVNTLGAACPIPRMQGIALDKLDPELKARLERGGDPVETRQLGHAPELYKKFLAYYTQMHYKGKLALRTKEIARLRIAQLNQCHY